jgi:hypothetical protein
MTMTQRPTDDATRAYRVVPLADELGHSSDPAAWSVPAGDQTAVIPP